jgi:hypothetical protein
MSKKAKNYVKTKPNICKKINHFTYFFLSSYLFLQTKRGRVSY